MGEAPYKKLPQEKNPEQKLHRYAKLLLENVEELHRTGFLHQDIAPDNVVKQKKRKGEPLNLKLIDWGLSIPKDQPTLAKEKQKSIFYVSPLYIESLATGKSMDEGYYKKIDEKEDIWKVGMTLYQLKEGRLPNWTKKLSKLSPLLKAEGSPENKQKTPGSCN